MSEVIGIDDLINKPCCPYCHKQLAHKASVERHIKDGCRVKNPNRSKQQLIKSEQELIKSNNDKQSALERIEQRMERMEVSFEKVIQNLLVMPMNATPQVNNNLNNLNNLNILCVGKNDNLLDMLSSAEGIANALTYMKDCVLAQLAGDCRILERAYKLDTEQAAIMYANKSKTKYRYYDERRRLTVEANAAVMAKKLAGILQRSYLKGMEGFKTNILGEKRECTNEKSLILEKMPELEAYDIHLWNEHIQRLADEKYQKKVLKSLKIPVAPPDG